MPAEITFYLDGDMHKNPDFSDKMNRFNRTLILVLGLYLILFAAYNSIFEGDTFILTNDSEQLPAAECKAPLESYEALRTLLRSWAGEHHIPVVE